MTERAHDAALTLRAVAETFVPGAAQDPTAGAPEVHAERFLAHYLDLLTPGLAEGTAAALDAIAADRREGSRFADLSHTEREDALDALAEHEVAELRPLASLLGALSLAAVYGEWTGQDESGALARRPVGWELTGYPGPGLSDPALMREHEEDE